MNPLDWSGPSFLAFYVVLCVSALILFQVMRARTEREGSALTTLTDPYEIASLRGGDREVIRTVVLSLLDRGLLERRDPRTLVTTSSNAVDSVRRPIEKAVLSVCSEGARPDYLLHADLIRAPAASFSKSLMRQGLLADASDRRRRGWFVLVCVVVILGLGAAKLQIALSRGHHNVWFLIGLMLLFGASLLAQLSARRSWRGDGMMRDLRSLFRSLRARRQSLVPGGATADVTYLISVFGPGALPSTLPYADVFPTWRERAFASGGDSVGGGCGAGCGSSCGGGCGGGCGGCGGG